MNSARVEEATRFITRSVESREGQSRRVTASGAAARWLVDALDRRVLSDGDAVPAGGALPSVRRLTIVSLPADPLSSALAAGAGDPIDVFIPMHEKDAWLAHLAVASIQDGAVSPLGSITLGIPDQQKVPGWVSAYGVEVMRDSEVLGLLDGGSSLSALPGWFLQQVLKLAFAMSSNTPTLIHDADTVLLRPRVWSSGGIQILPLRWKTPRHFARSTARALGSDACLAHASSVTHHQLMKATVLRAAFGTGPEVVDRLTAWIEGHSDSISPSEYQLYGSQLRLTNPSGWVPAGWHHANGKVASSDLGLLPELSPAEALATISRLREAFPGVFGLSLHARR